MWLDATNCLSSHSAGTTVTFCFIVLAKWLINEYVCALVSSWNQADICCCDCVWRHRWRVWGASVCLYTTCSNSAGRMTFAQTETMETLKSPTVTCYCPLPPLCSSSAHCLLSSCDADSERGRKWHNWLPNDLHNLIKGLNDWTISCETVSERDVWEISIKSHILNNSKVKSIPLKAISVQS